MTATLAPRTQDSKYQLMFNADQEFRVGGSEKFILTKKLGSGAFGDIYLGVNVLTGEEVAVKLESTDVKNKQLRHESELYKILQGGVGIPRFRWFGDTGVGYHALVVEALGPSLEDLFVYCNRKFSIKSVLMLMDQALSRIEFMHKRLFIHRDIKPDNLLMGLGERSTDLYLIDFGLSNQYRDHLSGYHIPYRTGKSMTGTARYASINALSGIEQSRRDDLEGLGYVMMYFLRGSLPWMGIKAVNKKQKYDKIREVKMSTSSEELAYGFPSEFTSYLSYVKELNFDETPDYWYLRQLFRVLARTSRMSYDFVYDWTKKKRLEELKRQQTSRAFEKIYSFGSL